MRRDVEDPFHQAGAAPRNLLELPPVLHRPAEADRHRGPRRAVHEAIRRQTSESRKTAAKTKKSGEDCNRSEVVAAIDPRTGRVRQT